MRNKGFCPRCGRLVNGEGSYEMFYIDGALVYRHMTCPISAEMAALPPITRLLPDYMTVAEAAALLRVSVSTIRLRIRRGVLPARRLQGGMTVLVRRGDVEGLLTAIGGVGDRPAQVGTPALPPPEAPARLDAPGSAPPRAGQVTGHTPDTGQEGEFDGSTAPAGLDLRDVPTALLTRRETDARGNYPGGYAVYKAEAAELDRRTRAPSTETAAR